MAGALLTELTFDLQLLSVLCFLSKWVDHLLKWKISRNQKPKEQPQITQSYQDAETFLGFQTTPGLSHLLIWWKD